MIDRKTLVQRALAQHDQASLAALGAELIAETRLLCMRNKQRFSVRQCADLAASARAIQYPKEAERAHDQP